MQNLTRVIVLVLAIFGATSATAACNSTLGVRPQIAELAACIEKLQLEIMTQNDQMQSMRARIGYLEEFRDINMQDIEKLREQFRFLRTEFLLLESQVKKTAPACATEEIGELEIESHFSPSQIYVGLGADRTALMPVGFTRGAPPGPVGARRWRRCDRSGDMAGSARGVARTA